MGNYLKVAETKVYAGNKTAIPKAVLEALGLKIGDYIEWHVEEEKIVVRKRG